MSLPADLPPTHRPHPLSRAELARRVNRSRAAITLALQGTLRAACLDGGRVDVMHPELLAFARRHWGVGPEVLTGGTTGAPASTADLSGGAQRGAASSLVRSDGTPARSVPAAPPVARVQPVEHHGQPQHLPQPEPDVESLLHLTVFELTCLYGSTQAGADFVALRKEIANVARLELANRERDGRLIPRELVAHHVFGAINTMNTRLLRDMPVTLAQRLRAAVHAGESTEELIRITRDLIGSELRTMKNKVVRALREPHEQQGKEG